VEGSWEDDGAILGICRGRVGFWGCWQICRFCVYVKGSRFVKSLDRYFGCGRAVGVGLEGSQGADLDLDLDVKSR